MKHKYNLGDLVRFTFYPGISIGIVVRGSIGLHSVLVLLNGRTDPSWLSCKYLEVISSAQ